MECDMKVLKTMSFHMFIWRTQLEWCWLWKFQAELAEALPLSALQLCSVMTLDSPHSTPLVGCMYDGTRDTPAYTCTRVMLKKGCIHIFGQNSHNWSKVLSVTCLTLPVKLNLTFLYSIESQYPITNYWEWSIILMFETITTFLGSTFILNLIRIIATLLQFISYSTFTN